MTQKVFAFLTFLIALFASTEARSAPARRVDLNWSAADSTCLDAEELKRIVEATLGRPVFRANSASSGRVSGFVERTSDGGYEVKLALTDAVGTLRSERRLDTQGPCGRLDESIAVVVALMIDDIAELPAPPLRVPRQMPAHTKAIGAPPLVFAFGVGAGESVGLLPGAAPHATISARLEFPSWQSVMLALRWHAPTDASVSGAGGTFTAWTVQLGGCLDSRGSAARLGVCGALGAGALSARPLALPESAPLSRPLILAEALADGQLKLAGPLWLRFEAGVELPFLRDPWGYDSADGAYVTVHRAAAVVPVIAISIILRSAS